jgi:class 3 adenylate cyclase/pimeloyl-ACP methyl ester carboxylesterase
MGAAQRRLAAILSADAVAYSRLMAEDEPGTVRALRDHQDAMRRRIEARRGRVVDSPGDNLLAELPSIVDAVACAAEIQRDFATRNESQPEARRMRFRIGVHFGDVIVEGERIYGDGVNVAARLEGLAEPGGVCLSGEAFDQVRPRLDLGFEELGEQRLKNVPRPVRVVRLRLDRPGGRPASSTRTAAHGPLKCRIEYFRSADGASIAAARGGRGMPLVIVPHMMATIETTWGDYADAFPRHEVITYDRRGSGLSERGSVPREPEPYLQDAQAVVDGFGLGEFAVIGTLLGTIEAAVLASRNQDRARQLVLRAPVTSLADWARIPAVEAALAALEHDWEFFTEAFAQLVVGWGRPNAPALAARHRAVTTRDELRALLDAYLKLDLVSVLAGIRAPTLVEHHPGYFFPAAYSRRIASLIEDCRMAIFSGTDFIGDFSIAQTFFADAGLPADSKP